MLYNLYCTHSRFLIYPPATSTVLDHISRLGVTKRRHDATTPREVPKVPLENLKVP